MLFLSSNKNIQLNNSKKLLNKPAYNAVYSLAIASKYIHCIPISNNENLLKCSLSAYGTPLKPSGTARTAGTAGTAGKNQKIITSKNTDKMQPLKTDGRKKRNTNPERDIDTYSDLNRT